MLAARNGGSVRGYQGTFALSALQQPLDRSRLQPPRLHIYASRLWTENARFCRIPRDSLGMMCVCRRRRLADKDLGQPAIGLQQTGPTGAGSKAARADFDRQCDTE
jgi:hypothetical protein